jgi:hypothetical protein
MKKLFPLFIFFVINLVFLTSNAQTDCKSATINNVKQEGSGNRMSWTMPAGDEEVAISHHSGNLYDSFGVIEDYGVFHRFIPEDLATINSGELTQVVFIPAYLKVFQTEPGHTYTVQIYQGGIWGAVDDRNPGTMISFQELNNDDLLFHEENAITLETPVTIDASQELWIGIFCTNIEAVQSQYKGSAGVDAGPRKEGLGNVFFYQNQWRTLYEVAWVWDNNWYIKGVVQTIEGESVNIYFNDEKIAENMTGTTYLHNNPTGEEYCYEIEVNCIEGGVSPLSNRICIPGVGIETITKDELRITLYPNPAKEMVTILSSTIINNIQIINIMGQEVFSSQTNGEKIDVNTSNLIAGLYFIRIHTATGFQNAKLIIE